MNTAILRRAGGGRALARRLTAAPRAAPAAVRNYGDKAKSTEELFETPPLPLNKQYRAPKGWDDPQMRRNFGDPMHEQEELVSMWGPDIPVIDPSIALRHFTIAFSIFAGIYALSCAVSPQIPAIRREYPHDGLKNAFGGYDQARPESIEEEN
ncbi:hypothetical protein K523DRAFT_289183 [Schizophyllum commune Tattone D]|nr:hypothetical protein K525DRAFT_259277 [Schizophyllum commune Loenen D]KAI5836394.1 hypothetical protein K523DRAFT_289183 [Schizophyllum commune Tattone D]